MSGGDTPSRHRFDNWDYLLCAGRVCVSALASVFVRFPVSVSGRLCRVSPSYANAVYAAGWLHPVSILPFWEAVYIKPCQAERDCPPARLAQKLRKLKLPGV